MKRIFIAVICGVSVLASGFSTVAAATTTIQQQPTAVQDAEQPSGILVRDDGYQAYLADYQASSPVASVTAVPIGDNVTAAEGKDACVDLRSGEGEGVYRLTVAQSGLYHLRLNYFTSSAYTRPIEISLKINGKTPFREAEEILLPKEYRNETNDFKSDKNGNQLSPVQVATNGWKTIDLYGGEFIGDGYRFYLEQGEQEITLTLVDGNVVFGELTAYNAKQPAAYTAPSDANKFGKDRICLQGEFADKKSDSTMYPTYDRSSPYTQPASATGLLLNTVGGSSSWGKNHQWMEWSFIVEQAGYYTINLRVRQNEAIGISTSRRVYLDGEIPYAEMVNYPFHYSTAWQMVTLSADEEPMLFYLDEGEHTIRIEAVPGEAETTVAVLESQLQLLNTLYRDIVMITGSTPDLSRDYYLDEQMPDLVSTMAKIAKNLRDEYTRASELSKSLGSQLSFLETFATQLESFCETIEELPERLSYFKTNISSLSSLMVTMKSLPLELDYLLICSPESELPEPEAGFFEMVGFELKRFLFSFINDYDAIGNFDESNYIEVWTTFGRDQAQLIRNIIDNSFSAESDISVKLCLLPGNSVVEPIMAGKGPDVLIGADRTLPVNLAARGLLLDLQKLDGFDEVKRRFSEQAMVPYTYGGGVYALPETQEYNMMFVRTDIFELLNITPPKTWEDVKKIAPVILQNNLEFGFPNGIQASITTGMSGALPTILPAMLLQNGMNWYVEDLSATVFSTRAGTAVFKDFTEIYAKYGGTVYYDSVNRFRTGEMPLMIAPFSTYNSLYIQAPEIKGLWKMYPIPGIATADGIDISEEDMGVATVLLAEGETASYAWEFMKWWSDAEIQSEYALKLETLLGPSARYSTANIEAFNTLSWSKEEIAYLNTQREYIQGIPAHPAAYIVSRNLANAFLEVISDGKSPMETIANYAITMDNELHRKMQQLKGTGERN